MRTPTDDNDKIFAGFMVSPINGLDGTDWLVLDYSGEYAGSTVRGIQLFTRSNDGVAVSLDNPPPGFQIQYDITNFEKFTVTASDGRDILYGQGLRDILKGRPGDDVIYGNEGSDRLFGGSGEDILVGGSGRDRLIGGLGDDALEGGDGKDLLKGGAGNDGLDGGAGNDTLRGGKGNDILETGQVGPRENDGNDKMFGGSGSDSFFVRRLFGEDTIADFDPSEDMLHFQSAMFGFLPTTAEQVVEKYGTFFADRLVFDFSELNSPVTFFEETGELTLLGTFSPDEVEAAIGYFF